MAVPTYQSSVEASLTGAGPVWSQSSLTNSNMKFSSPHVSTASVENRTSNRPAGVISQAKRQSSSAIHSQSDHVVIVIDDSPDVDVVPNLSGLESTSFNGRPNKFQEGNSVDGLSNYDSIFRSGKAWPQVSSIPSLFSSCKESTIARGSNLQRAKEVQAELRRLGITNPGNYGQPAFAVHPQYEPEVIIIDDTPDEEAVSNLSMIVHPQSHPLPTTTLSIMEFLVLFIVKHEHPYSSLLKFLILLRVFGLKLWILYQSMCLRRY
jgi:hypothetical protein